jgi:carboxymethylenebutenolidase
MGEWQTLFTPCGAVQAWLARPEGESRGAVVVVQEIFGVTGHVRSVCGRLAEAGFTALAPAFFDLVETGVELPYDADGTRRGRELVEKLGLDCALDVAEEAARTLRVQGQAVGVVGFCWGGTIAFLAATRLGLPAVSYYGARNTGFLDEAARAPLMFHFGALDPSIPPDAVEAHRQQQPQAQLFVYDGAGHAFNRDPGHHWHPEAAALAWRRTLAFFEEHLR